jgi:arylsulfatase A-like enzyme
MVTQPNLKTQPNVVLINCDDLGFGDLGCYGSACNRTLALKRMAWEGIRFTDFYMVSPLCSPSRGAMLTGCYPPRIGFGSFDGDGVLFPGSPLGMNPREVTLATLLKQAGYATQLVGKWHCGDQKEFLPTRHGFDSYYGLPYSNDMGRQYEDDRYPPLPLLLDEEVIQQQPDQSGLTERYVEQSIRFIRENASGPSFFTSHTCMSIYPSTFPMNFCANRRMAAMAAVECIDWAADAILHELRVLGLDENTLAIFTSDNGSRCQGEGGSNGILRGTKGTTWEGGLRVPCIMRWPGRIPPGTVCGELATAMDFYPTLAELGGAEIPQDRIIDGKNILPLMLSGGEAPSPHEVFFYYLGNQLEAVRDRTWKLNVRKRGEEIRELYNLEEDPGETRNLYDSNPEVVKALSEKLDACREDIGDEALGIQGKNVRPIGRVDHPRPLTQYNPEHPYIIAMYDLKDRG